MALIRELFSNCIEAARILGVDSDFAAKLQAARARLVPYQIGKHGQLQEWSQDFDEPEPGQRHMSHMYPLYPGSEITPRRTPELAKAAAFRSNGAWRPAALTPGWSRAWAINFWARLLDGDQAWESVGPCCCSTVHRPQPFRYAPCRRHLDLPDRRQFRRRGSHRRDAAAEPRRRDRLPPCPARRLARWQRQRPARPGRPHGRSLLGQGQSRLRRSRAYPGRRTHSAAAARPEDLRHPWNSRTRRRCESTAATPANLSRQLCRRCRYTSATGSPTTLK